MTRLHNESTADDGLFVAAVSSFTLSLLAFLPVQVAALSHVVERIDSLAMTPVDRLVEAARQKNLKLFQDLAWNFRFDLLSVATAAIKETVKTSEAIGSCLQDWDILSALDNATQPDTIKLLYSWIKGSQAKMNALPSKLEIAATNGHFDILEFAFERIVEQFLGEDPDKLQTRRKRRHKSSKIAGVLQTFQSVQRWFRQAFYTAFLEGHKDFAERIYATIPSCPACIKDKVFQTAVGCGWIDIVEFIFSKGRSSNEASNRAFKDAADCGYRYCDILALLVEKADVSAESVEREFTRAIRSRSIDVATLLRSNKRIPPTLLNKLSEDAIYRDVGFYTTVNSFQPR